LVTVVGNGLVPFRLRVLWKGVSLSHRSGWAACLVYFCGVQPDIGNLALLRTLYASIRDVRFNPIRFAQGQAEEPDLRVCSLRQSMREFWFTAGASHIRTEGL